MPYFLYSAATRTIAGFGHKKAYADFPMLPERSAVPQSQYFPLSGPAKISAVFLPGGEQILMRFRTHSFSFNPPAYPEDWPFYPGSHCYQRSPSIQIISEPDPQASDFQNKYVTVTGLRNAAGYVSVTAKPRSNGRPTQKSCRDDQPAPHPAPPPRWWPERPRLRLAALRTPVPTQTPVPAAPCDPPCRWRSTAGCP